MFNKNKIFKVVICILLLLMIVGCKKNKKEVDHTGEVYTISYIYDDEVLNFELADKYTCGKIFQLPTFNTRGFEGWYTTKDFTGEKVDRIGKNDFGNKIFYAKVVYVKQTYSIKYLYDDLELDQEPKTYTEGDCFDLPIPTPPEGKEFKGWYTEKECKNLVDVINEFTEGNQIFYAKFEKIKETFDIKYYYNDDEMGLEPAKYTEGDSIDLPIPENISGEVTLKFAGWYLENTFLNKVDKITSSDTGNKTFYAKYTTGALVSKRDAENATRLNDAKDLVNNGDGITRGMPSIGDVKVLVVPVEFTDYKADNTMKSDIEKTLFGTSEETGWESLSSYYKKSSYGKLNITGTVTDVYNTNKKSTYYDYMDSDGYYPRLCELIHDVLTYFDNSIDYNEYDSDNDGMIDSIYLVYTTPTNYDDDESVWWAFTDEYLTEDYDYFDGIEADYYMFAGIDFISEIPSSGAKLNYNAETFIHETGHLLGLDDYYDYDDTDHTNVGGLGGCDMMDYNVGDHNPYSKTLLGWITPTIIDISKKEINEQFTYNIKSFGESGDAIFIARKFDNSYYTEYFVIDYFTCDGLNEMEKGNCGLFSTNGIVIYHVMSELCSEEIACVWDMTKYNNATSKYKLISIVEADGKNDVSKGNESSNSDLYKAGDVINNLKWNDGNLCVASITINSINEDGANISIK